MKLYTKFLCIIISCLFIFSTLTPTINAQPPGLITSISGNGISNIINQVLPIVFARIQEMSIDPITESHVTISNLVVKDLSLSNFQITTRNNAEIVLSLNSLHAAAKCHFKYKTTLLSFSGDITASTTGSGLVAAKLNPSGDHFTIALTQADVNIEDFKISISGGIVAKILNIVKSVFQGIIKRTIKSKLSTAIHDAIVTLANKFANSIPSSFSFGTAGNTISLAPASFGTLYDDRTSSVSVAFNGAINNIDTVPHHNIDQNYAPTGALFDFLIDIFVFNSGFQIIPFKVMSYDVNHPGTIPVPGWKGSDWSLVIPAMAILYPNEDVRIEISLLDKPTMDSINGQVSITATGGYRIFAGQTQIALIKAEIHGGVTVTMDKRSDGKQYIIPQLQNIGVKFTVVESFSGDIVLVGVLETILNVLSQIAVGVINETMLNGLVIPSIAGLEFINPRIDFPNGAIRVATDISFNPTPF